MGFFSWKTQDTSRSICNCHSGQQTFTVFMHDNKGNKWEEDSYGGYGVFAGKDYYQLLAQMNGRHGRDVGLTLAFNPEPGTRFPNLTEARDWEWRNEPPEDCEYQGYFYDNDETKQGDKTDE